ncbi:sulfatase [Pontiella agarivorans]|uniref:Sulfatase n=1 Tax=Pontiella agarivorans TaxID=3038953 RepID=A0ABU5MS43_9BACT|nr:sulfatase [Pontiella agarivorans]MDZ8117030.1 sulfatase [Pontiella agarivorans]
MKIKLNILITGLLIFSAQGKVDDSPRERLEKPNILFILIDDFGWNDVGYNGSTFYETPRLDQLASEWIRLDYCYTPSPMCSPTRTSILTGKNPARHGVTQWLPGRDTFYGLPDQTANVYCPTPLSKGIKESEVTLGEAFQSAGYETAFMGKWHMGKFKVTGGPANHGYAFTQAVIEENGCDMFYPFRGHPEYFPNAKKGDNFTDLLTDAAIDFVTADREKPFYLHLCHFAMHHPIGSKPELREYFEQKRAALPVLENDRIQTDHMHKPQKFRQDDPEYAGELATLDENIGRLVDALKAAGQYENTIIVFTGDNGGRTSYHREHPTSVQPLRAGKTFVYEGGLRTPLLIHLPKYSGTKTIDVPVSSMDFYPTLLDLAGLPLKPEQHLDGVNLAPLFDGKTIEREPFVWHFPHYQHEGSYPSSAIRMGDYKLIHDYFYDDEQLFDVVNDPYEKNDLAARHPERTKRMKEQLMAYLKNAGAYLPVAPTAAEIESMRLGAIKDAKKNRRKKKK